MSDTLLTSEDYQRMVVEALNKAGDDTFAGRVRRWWTSNARRATISDKAQYLYTLREAIRWAQGQGWETNYDMSSGSSSLSRRGRAINLKEMLQDVNSEIEEEKVLARSGRAPLAGTITKTVLLPQTIGRADPNDRYYRGDPVVQRPVGQTDKPVVDQLGNILPSSG